MKSGGMMLATLILNEIEWLQKLWDQHKDWPGMVSWCFVESADRMYAEANPAMVSKDGLSVDGTTELLEKLAAQNPKVTHIKHGFAQHNDLAQGKCQARQRYLDFAERIRPEFLLILDSDEFYGESDQNRLPHWFRAFPNHDAFIIPYRNIWRPPSLQGEPLFSKEVVGGFWAIPHCHGWRWQAGMRYSGNHMCPCSADGTPLNLRTKQFRSNSPGAPQCIHLAFASDVKNRHAKHAYYRARGEGVTDRRAWYVASRAAFENWTPQSPALPKGAKVIPYEGPVPEVFQNERSNS